MGLAILELVMCWEASLGVEIDDADADRIDTPAGATAYFAELLDATDSRYLPCPTQRAFHRLRAAIAQHREPPAWTLDTRLGELLARPERAALAAVLLPPSRRPRLATSSGRTLRDMANELVACHTCVLLEPRERWSVAQVRAVVRAAVAAEVGHRQFSDDHHLRYQLGID